MVYIQYVVYIQYIEDTQYIVYIQYIIYIQRFLGPVAQALDWPASHISLTLNEVTVKYTHRISERRSTNIFTLLRTEGGEVVGTGEVIEVLVYKYPPPTEFGECQSCMCDFGGCCRNCNTPCGIVCWGCGNTGCCRSGNCGHPCCEVSAARPKGSCQIVGCRPWWADSEQSVCHHLIYNKPLHFALFSIL
jgi:hypothetical protein